MQLGSDSSLNLSKILPILNLAIILTYKAKPKNSFLYKTLTATKYYLPFLGKI